MTHFPPVSIDHVGPLPGAIEEPSVLAEQRTLITEQRTRKNGKAYKIIREKLTGFERFAQFLKLFILIAAGLLSLGILFISSTFRESVRGSWKEFKTGKTLMKVWGESNLPIISHTTSKFVSKVIKNIKRPVKSQLSKKKLH